MLIKEGYLEKDEQGGLTVVAARPRRVEDKALDELFTIARKDSLGKHASDFKGAGQVRHEDSKPYEFGDPVANLNLHETLKNAMTANRERARAGERDEATGKAGHASCPRRISSFTKRNIRPAVPRCCCST